MLCPTCRKKAQFAENNFRPFCSERCRVIDLGKWASGTYSFPGERISLEQVEDSEGSVPDDSYSSDFFRDSSDDEN
jgi:endogenous inhibitor of DNA gyrase (YacG/DUF329 family)